jgi:uncharacterized protein (TIGR00269 family)
MKCKRCKKAEAEVSLRRHNAAFCRGCFLSFFENQVKRGIKEFHLLTYQDRILVCVSGGKDSLVLWDILLRLGYEADGMYIDLGIGGYSKKSKEKVQEFAAGIGRVPLIVDLGAEGMTIPDAHAHIRKKECSLCGTLKRHFFNAVARREGYDVVATGHNLDDEASRLLGNLVQWNREHIMKQSPLLPETSSGLVKKVKPLIRLTEYETACYALIKKIDYIMEECPLAEGATSLTYKDALNSLEEKIPGVKARFLLGFLDKGKEFLGEREVPGDTEESSLEGTLCRRCGEPSFMPLCSFCRIKEAMESTDLATKGGNG